MFSKKLGWDEELFSFHYLVYCSQINFTTSITPKNFDIFRYFTWVFMFTKSWKHINLWLDDGLGTFQLCWWVGVTVRKCIKTYEWQFFGKYLMFLWLWCSPALSIKWGTNQVGHSNCCCCNIYCLFNFPWAFSW